MNQSVKQIADNTTAIDSHGNERRSILLDCPSSIILELIISQMIQGKNAPAAPAYFSHGTGSVPCSPARKPKKTKHSHVVAVTEATPNT
jgi:hypothetical protein